MGTIIPGKFTSGGRPYSSTGNQYSFGNPSFEDFGLNSSFRDRFDAALAANDPTTIDDTSLDRLANFFGFRSSADKLRIEMNQRRNDAIQQLVNQQAEQEYNSEAASASRMRGAGLNPDLLGLDQASEATEGIEPQTLPNFGSLTSGADFATGFLTAFQNTLNLASGIQAFRLNGINISDKVLDLGSKIRGKTVDVLRDLLSKDSLGDYFSSGSSFEFSDSVLSNYGLRTKRERNMFREYASNLRDSYAGQIEKYKSVDDFLAAQDSALLKQSAWYRQDGDNDSNILPLLKGFALTLHNLEAIDAEYRTALAEYNKSYTEGLDASAASGAANAKARFEGAYNEALNPTDAADALNAKAQYEGDYYHSRNGEQEAGLKNLQDSYNKKRQEEMDKYFDKLISAGDPLSIILYIELMTGQSILSGLNDVVSTPIVGAGVAKEGLKRGADNVVKFFDNFIR